MRGRRKRRRLDKRLGTVFFTLIIVVFTIVLVMYSFYEFNVFSDNIRHNHTNSEEAVNQSDYRHELGLVKYNEEKEVQVKSINETSRDKGLLAIIIDDLGNNYELSMRVLDIRYPITVAILPYSYYGRLIMEEARRRGKEVILHQPMQAINTSRYDSVGMLYVSMTKYEIERVVRENLSIISEAVGVNNHMGSLFTQDEERMRYFLEIIREKGLYYVDSLTHPNSKGYLLAKSMGIKTIKRDIFLDNVQTKELIKENLYKSVNLANKKGYALVVAHPYEETIMVLNEELDKINSMVNIVYVSDILKRYH